MDGTSSGLGSTDDVTTATVSTNSQSRLTDTTVIGISAAAVFLVLLVLTVLVVLLLVFGLRKRCCHCSKKHKKKNGRFSESQVGMMSVAANTSTQTNTEFSSTLLECSSPTTLNYSSQLEETLMDSMVLVSLPRHRQFMPKFGLMVPQYDFSRYNEQRTQDDQEFSYPCENLLLVRTIVEGWFGKVSLMKANGICGHDDLIPVVVKYCEHVEKKGEFFKEVELLKKFVHQNVVSLLGVSEYDDVPMMILEYMPFGDLKSFLQKHSPTTHQTELIENSQALTEESIPLTEEYFYRFALDVANALGFLEENMYVYGNTAAKNCLVGAGIRVKITNFSSSVATRDENQDASEDKDGDYSSMMQWLSPESLLKGEFTSASDVWSYGVLLWEIVSYGQTPLEGVDMETILTEAAEGTLIHSRPDTCPDDIHSVMSSCFKHDAMERLSFQDILHSFKTKRSTSVKF